MDIGAAAFALVLVFGISWVLTQLFDRPYEPPPMSPEERHNQHVMEHIGDIGDAGGV